VRTVEFVEVGVFNCRNDLVFNGHADRVCGFVVFDGGGVFGCCSCSCYVAGVIYNVGVVDAGMRGDDEVIACFGKLVSIRHDGSKAAVIASSQSGWYGGGVHVCLLAEAE